MTSAPLVSIVIVSYNNWPDIELAIESALRQSYHPIEVIVVDNTSTDRTFEELERRFSDAIRRVRQANTGDAGAYNTGMRLARGEFVQFLDGDDVLSPYKIEKQIEVFLSAPETDIVYGDTRLFQSGEGAEAVTDTDTKTEEDLLGAFLESEGDYFGNTLGLLLRKTALERVGPWDETIYVTDADYWLRALWADCRFRHCPGALMGFVGVGPGKMAADYEKMWRGQEALWNKAMGFVARQPYRDMVLKNLARIRYYSAVLGEGAGLPKSLEKLAQARAACPEAISLLACAAGAAALLIPGGRALARSPRLRLLRRAVARAAGYVIAR